MTKQLDWLGRYLTLLKRADEYAKAVCELTLAYTLIIFNLDEFS